MLAVCSLQIPGCAASQRYAATCSGPSRRSALSISAHRLELHPLKMPMTTPFKPYSYRDDPRVPPFDDRAPLIIFDGLCVLCSSGVQWMLARDPNGISQFATIQQPLPRALYRHYNLDADRFDTFMVVADGIAYTRWAGVVAAGRTLPQPWRILAGIARLVPAVVGDWFYDIVQRNRLRWFGSRQACLAPTAQHRARFLASV